MSELLSVEDKNQFLHWLLKVGMLQTDEPKTLKSTRVSPYFLSVNLGYGMDLLELSRFYAKLVEMFLANRGGETDDVLLLGPAYKGIPLVTTTATELARQCINLRWMADRKEAKDHGEKVKFIGSALKDGDRVIIIEDVTTSGQSVQEMVEFLNTFGKSYKIVALMTVMDRMEVNNDGVRTSEQLCKTHGCEYHSIVTVCDLYRFLFPWEGSWRDRPREQVELAGRMEGYFYKYAPAVVAELGLQHKE